MQTQIIRCRKRHLIRVYTVYSQDLFYSKSMSDTPLIGNGLIQLIRKEETTWHEWVKRVLHCNQQDVRQLSHLIEVMSVMRGSRHSSKKIMNILIWCMGHNEPKFLNRQVWSNSADPDLTDWRSCLIKVYTDIPSAYMYMYLSHITLW